MHTPFHRRTSRLEEGPTMTLIKLFELYNSSSHHSESQMANKTNWLIEKNCRNNITITHFFLNHLPPPPPQKNETTIPKAYHDFSCFESMHLDQIDGKSHRTHSDDEPQISRSPVEGWGDHDTPSEWGKEPPPQFNIPLPPAKSRGSLIEWVPWVAPIMSSHVQVNGSRGDFQGCQNVKPDFRSRKKKSNYSDFKLDHCFKGLKMKRQKPPLKIYSNLKLEMMKLHRWWV